jgi:5-methylcytosine-specific restriction endonuclease McrA
VHPRSKGGKTTWNNVVVACHPCNRKKGNRSLERINMRLARKPKRPSWKELMGEEETDEPKHEWLPWLDYVG